MSRHRSQVQSQIDLAAAATKMSLTEKCQSFSEYTEVFRISDGTKDKYSGLLKMFVNWIEERVSANEDSFGVQEILNKSFDKDKMITAFRPDCPPDVQLIKAFLYDMRFKKINGASKSKRQGNDREEAGLLLHYSYTEIIYWVYLSHTYLLSQSF